MNNTFDINRFWKYCKLNFEIHKKLIVITLFSLLGVDLFFSFLVGYFANGIIALEITHFVLIGLLLTIGTSIVASRAFSSINNTEQSIAYFSLPVSTFEKFLYPLIYTSLVWFITVILLLTVGGNISNFLFSELYGFDYAAFNPLNLHSIDQHIKDFVLIELFSVHSLFFLGASAFRKYAFGKTLLAQYVVQSYFGLLTVLCMVLFVSFEAMNNLNISDKTTELLLSDYSIYLHLFSISLCLIFYTAAFYKLKEREV